MWKDYLLVGGQLIFFSQVVSNLGPHQLIGEHLLHILDGNQMARQRNRDSYLILLHLELNTIAHHCLLVALVVHHNRIIAGVLQSENPLPQSTDLFVCPSDSLQLHTHHHS